MAIKKANGVLEYFSRITNITQEIYSLIVLCSDGKW